MGSVNILSSAQQRKLQPAFPLQETKESKVCEELQENIPKNNLLFLNSSILGGKKSRRIST